MIELRDKRLIFWFPEVHEDATLEIEFQRTLRIPDDNRAYPLPPGVGPFPLNHVDDYLERLPAEWRQAWRGAVESPGGRRTPLPGRGPGGVPMYQAEAMGAGYSAEEQLTGEAQHGGLQIAVYPMQASSYEAMTEAYVEEPLYAAMPAPEPELGLAPGGLMRQEVYEDSHGFDAWDTSVRSRCFVHILNSVQFLGVTGGEPPQEPVSAQDYSAAGLPWFEYYGADLEALAGARKLAGMDSVAARSLKVGDGVIPGNEPVTPLVVGLSARPVREGEF